MRALLCIALAAVSACGQESPPAPVVAPSTTSHDHHAHGGGHMEGMEAQRERLRAALGDSYEQPVAGLELANANRGRAVYEARCLACNGEAGKGNGPAGAALSPPPADFTDPEHATFYSDAGRVAIIREGVPETAMPGFGGALAEAEVLDVYAYVRSLGAASVTP